MTSSRVLIIDADVDTRRVAVEALELEGFDVVVASCAADALGALDSGGRPAIVLLDPQMPSLAGESLLPLIREHPRAQGAPIVAMLASGGRPAEVRGRCDGWLEKPVDPHALYALLATSCMPSTSDPVECGIRSLDVEHGLQFRLADALVRSLVPGSERQASPILDDLVDVTRAHFAYEAELMQRHRYPDAAEHEREHVAWLREADELRIAPARRFALGAGVAVRNSMVDHVRSMDHAFARHLSRRGARV